jgi:hypothetical protein
MNSLRRTLIPLLAALACGTIAFGVSACGYESHEKEVVEGEPVTLGEVKYNVVFSRFLNPNDTEDSAYLVGQDPPPPRSSYFGVFFEVQNEHDEPQPLPDSFTIHDAEHTAYESIESESLYAFPFGAEVEAEEQIPVLDSTAQQGPIEGSLVLFLLPDTVADNRPLVLEVEGPDGPGEITLDL